MIAKCSNLTKSWEFQSLKVTILKPWAYGPTSSARPEKEQCGVFFFQEEPFFLISHGGFLKWWYPTTIGFPTKNDHFGVFWGYHHLRKHPHKQLIPISSTFGCSDVCVLLFFKYILCSTFSWTSINFPHHVSSHAIECPSLVLPYHFLIWILFSSYHFSPAFPTILASI